ncbi:MAG TPA: hypothetical protein VKB55_16610 [Nocardioidaceae bacterium]|nr:hypothetical protein [Nocardioidaceae bacterium]
MSRRARVVVALWPWLLSAVICAPLLAPGYVLSYDMVWVPNLTAQADTWGWGTALPRVVPSDLLVAVFDEIVPGQILQKLVLVGALGLAGAGAARLCRDRGPVAALAAASLYVWNPFVAERLLLGHWPLLVGYAALPWILVAGRRLRVDEWSAWSALALGLAVSAVSAVGGVLGVLVALASQAGGDAASRRRRLGLTAAVGVAVNAPWFVAGLVYPGGATTDPAAVERFGASSEGWLGHVGAVLSLGGIWNSEVMPDSRDTPIALLGLVTVGVVVVAGWRLWLAADRTEALAFLGLAGLGVVVALAGWAVPDAVGWLVAHAPGLGLIRDGTRFLPLLALPAAIAFGWAAGAAADRLRSPLTSFAAVLAVIWPLALLPDLAWGGAGDLEPVAYPDSWYDTRDVISGLNYDGALLVLPFTAYRAPTWNDGRPVLDPAGRFFGVSTLVNDDLFVSGQLIEGENPQAASVQTALTDSGGADLAGELGRLGIGAVVVSIDAGPVGADLSGLDQVSATADLDLYTVPGPIADPPQPSTSRVVAIALAWIVAGATTVVAIGDLARRRLRRGTRTGAPIP